MPGVSGLLLSELKVSLQLLWLVRILFVISSGSSSDCVIKSCLSFMSWISWHTWVIFEVRVCICDTDLNMLLNYLLCPFIHLRLSSQMKNTWYWSIIKIPLKVYRQPIIIHELGLEYYNGNSNSAQGPLLLEEDNRRLRLLTTREEVSNLLDPYTLYVSHFIQLCLFIFGQDKGHWLFTQTKRDHQYQEDLGTVEDTLEQDLQWPN